jgi:hypothetical protein
MASLLPNKIINSIHKNKKKSAVNLSSKIRKKSWDKGKSRVSNQEVCRFSYHRTENKYSAE